MNLDTDGQESFAIIVKDGLSIYQKVFVLFDLLKLIGIFKIARGVEVLIGDAYCLDVIFKNLKQLNIWFAKCGFCQVKIDSTRNT